MSASQPWRAAFAVASVVALLPIAGCESPSGQVTVLQSPSVAVTPGSSYAWAATPAADTPDPRIDNDITRERLRTAVDTALAAKGYRQAVDPAAAQLLVAYHVSLRESPFTRGGSGPPLCGMSDCVWGVFRAPATSAMVLDLTDRASGRLAWRATSETRTAPNATQAGLNAIVMDMTKTLPGG